MDWFCYLFLFCVLCFRFHQIFPFWPLRIPNRWMINSFRDYVIANLTLVVIVSSAINSIIGMRKLIEFARFQNSNVRSGLVWSEDYKLPKKKQRMGFVCFLINFDFLVLLFNASTVSYTCLKVVIPTNRFELVQYKLKSTWCRICRHHLIFFFSHPDWNMQNFMHHNVYDPKLRIC